jgi:hypothetical protein
MEKIKWSEEVTNGQDFERTEEKKSQIGLVIL